MTEPNSTSIEPYRAIAPRPKFALFPRRREDYPVIQTPEGDHRVILPLQDYRKFRGETSYWQFLFLVVFLAFVGLAAMALLQPPVYVEKPFVVEKEKPVLVPSKCLVFCK